MTTKRARFSRAVRTAPKASFRFLSRTGHSLFLVVVIAIYFVVPIHAESDRLGLFAGLIATALCLAIVIFILIREALYVRASGASRLGVIQLLLLIEVSTIMFALAYYAMSVFAPDQMVGITTRMDALYFTMTTLATTGYGDIHAQGQLARGVVALQLAFNVGFIAMATQMVQASFNAGRMGGNRLHRN
ncbi:potassium channel family protein [Micrococcoides hystricis]|uniref:Potassium channel family protein n=1 Tax=Micrococcoides hystricis TaxID=1572761 RepID=A0ABV6P7T1_9MICC